MTVVPLAWVMVACAGCALVRPPVPTPPVADKLAVYVGTYTGSGSRGIYRFELDPESGAWTEPVLAGESANPSFLALHPNGRVLYAVNELGAFRGSPTGAVSAFAIDAMTGGLTPLGQQASGGRDPCHVVVDGEGRNVLVANYTEGSVAVLPVDPGGHLLPASTVRRDEGSGPDRSRQEGPHAHAIVLDRAESLAFAADLGADRIFLYRFDGAAGTLEPHDPGSVALEPGSGPRHLAWHPKGPYLYAINELRSTVAAFRYDPGRGTLVSLQTVTTLPAGFSGKNKAAEVVASPDGRFLYGSNRGDDSVAIFSVDAGSGLLSPAGHVSTGGRTPRHLAIDPSGRWLLVANQDSDSIGVFLLDRETGRPLSVGQALSVPTPVCVLFGPPSKPREPITPPRTAR